MLHGNQQLSSSKMQFIVSKSNTHHLTIVIYDIVTTFCVEEWFSPGNSSQVWKLSAMDMEDDDEHLVETDLKKPYPNFLKGN